MSLAKVLPSVEVASANHHVLQTIQALSDTLPSPPNIQEIASHYAVSVAEANEMVRPHLDSKAVELIIGDGGVLLYRISQSLSGNVRSGLCVAELLPDVNEVLARRVELLQDKTAEIMQRLTANQNLASGDTASVTELLSALGDLCHDVAEASSEIDDALSCQDEDDANMAAYLLTRAKATMLAVPVSHE